jgi:peroxiredoxin
MKIIAFLLFMGLIFASCTSRKDQFQITGSVNGVDTGVIFLQQYDSDKWVDIDSSLLDKGEFSFKGKIDLPEMWHIAMKGNQVLVPVFVENSKIEVQIFPDSLEKSTIKGSASHDIYLHFLALNEPINFKTNEVYKEWKKAKEARDTLGMERNDSISRSLDAELKQQLQVFAKTNNKTVVSPYLVMRNSWQFELPELEEIVNEMDSSLNRSLYLQVLQKRVEILKRVSVGRLAPDFEMNDTTGKAVRLSSLKGKILLVYFWASWCGPCRAENPKIVKTFRDFGSKGFDVLGCSFDHDRAKWTRAIRDDQLVWNNVSDLEGWGNSAGKLYGVSSIPANVLLDKDQKIIGRNLLGQDLVRKLEEVLGRNTPEKRPARRK